MTIEEAKAALEEGQTLELDLPLRGKYLPANYHVWINQKRELTINVKYGGEYARREPFVASLEWGEFVSQLPPVCQYSDEWTVL